MEGHYSINIVAFLGFIALFIFFLCCRGFGLSVRHHRKVKQVGVGTHAIVSEKKAVFTRGSMRNYRLIYIRLYGDYLEYHIIAFLSSYVTAAP